MRTRRRTRSKDKKNNKIQLQNKMPIKKVNYFTIFSVLLIVVFIMIAILGYKRNEDKKLLSRQKEELEKQTDEIFTLLEQSKSASSQVANSSNMTASLAIVGDILCGNEMMSDANNGSNYNFNNMISDVSKYTQNADIAVGTLETNFTNNNYSGAGKYNSPIEFLDTIKSSGIDLVSVAHNHELDYGKDGLISTVNSIKERNLSITGIKNNSENENKDFTGNIKEVKGIKIAFLGYTYGLSNEEDISEEDKKDANIYSEEKVKNDMEYAKANSNYIIVIMHWGEVNDSSISTWQENVKDYLINSGADMILGSHPSVIEPMKMLQNKEGKNVLVAYSLGNYISSLKYENADVELILNVQILKKANDEKAYLQKVDYTPIYVEDNGKNAEERFKLKNMKDLAINYSDGNTKEISRSVYNTIIKKLDWLDKLLSN